VIARVLVAYEDDAGLPLWQYLHAEAIPHSDDLEQMALIAVANLVEHADKARDAIVKQARIEIKNIPADLDELLNRSR